MPGKVKVRILAGRNLPVMDRASDTSDAFVEVKLGNTTYKTEVCRRSLNPQWNSEWFKFEVDDEELQDEPLQIRIMDYDTYSANDAIGKVYIDLNPLLNKETGPVMSGWFPIYDTMHGLRGEIHVMVKVDLFSDSNKYRESSCGVLFFYSHGVPHCHRAQAILGFVEELVVNDDPEYQWIDKIRTPRASNEARQTLFSKLSGEVQRKIGLKALELGGNAVIGYHQCFDLEGESGIVVRGIGTAVTLVRLVNESNLATSPPKESTRDAPSLRGSGSSPSLLLCPAPVYRKRTSPSASLRRVLSTASLSSSSPPSPTLNLSGGHRQSCVLGRSRSPSPLKWLPCSPRPLPKCQIFSSNRMPSPPCTSRCRVAIKTPDIQSQDGGAFRRQNSLKLTQQRIKRVVSQPSTATTSASISSNRSVPQSGLKRICSDPLCPSRSPGLEDNPPIAVTTIATTANLHGHISPVNPGPITKMAHSPSKGSLAVRRLSDPDLSTTPKGTTTASGLPGGGKLRPPLNKDGLDMLEYPFITMKQFPPHVIQHIGGVVSSRSVKLLDQINNPDDPETRDAWWTEIRKEIRSHTRALGCNVVLGYSEATDISDDVCILSASGTAAILLPTVEYDNSFNPGSNHAPMLGLALTSRPSTGMDRRVSSGLVECEKDKDLKAKERPLSVDVNLANQTRHPYGSDWSDYDQSNNNVCSLCHIAYSESSVPFSANLTQCAICRRSKVPDVLFMTIEPPPGIPITGKGCFIQARVIRTKKDSKGEQSAKDISDSLPFLEYELHKQLLAKMKVKGMNGLFGLNLSVAVGEKVIIGIASGTSAFLTSLPVPSVPKITSVKGADPTKLVDLQKLVQDTVKINKECYDLRPPVIETVEEHVNGRTEDGEMVMMEELNEIDFSSGNKDAFVLEVDDNEVDIVSLLSDHKPPPGFELCNTETLPGMAESFISNIQMFTRVYRTKILPSHHASSKFAQHFEFLLQSLFVKLRKLTPCCIAGLQFEIDLIDQDELQVYVNGVAVGLGESGLLSIASQKSKAKHNSLPSVGTESEPDLLFNMDMEKSGEISKPTMPKTQISLSQSAEGRFHFNSIRREHFGIELTPLTYVPGGKIEHYLGNLDFFFIRESTSIRESGGLSGFIQSFVTEVLAIVRAHVAALGGNAFLSFKMTKCILMYNPHKNQGQCLIQVAGDAVSVQYSTTQHLTGLPATIND